MALAEIKGLSLLNYPVVLGELRGPAVRDALFSTIPSELRERFASGEIVANGWYPVTWKCALHEAGTQVTGEPGLARTMGYETTKRDLQGIYALLIRATSSPRNVLSRSSRVLGRYLRPVQLQIHERTTRSVKFEFTKGEGFNQELWEDVLGGCMASLEVAGARRLDVEVERGGKDGDSHATFIASWAETGD